MTLIRRWVLVLCLAWLPLNYSNAQDLIPGQVYTTNNIVQQTQQGGPSTWVNGVYQNNLTCWGGGDPGYCGPNAIVRPGNNINFSYGTTNLYQLQAIASALPSTGSGLLVNGYNFGFTAKNGNGWDDGRVDYLTAYVSFYSPNGSVAFNKNYDLNYKFNWTTFNYSETFTTPFASKDLSSVQYGFVGRDNNFWAGPYGPEIYNVSFSLKYSVDPCVSNPLYSPSCAGYIDALNKLKPPVIEQTALLQPVTENLIIQPVVVASVPVTTQVSTVATQPSVIETTTQKSTINTNKILSIIGSVQAQTSAIERSVVQQATQEAAKQANKATQEAEAFAATQSQQSQQDSQQIQQNLSSTSIPQTFLNSNRQDFSLQPGSVNQRNNTSFRAAAVNSAEIFFQNLPHTNIISNIAPQQAFNSNITVGIVETNIQQNNLYSLVPIKTDPLPEVNTEQKQVIGPTNLLEKFLDSTPTLDNVSQQQQSKPINQKAQDSELAGQVSLANIAKQPQGFQTYMAILQDVPFYKSTEIYRNQSTVDNQRVMRALSGASELKHKELVDIQYRR
jgi:hypothetical protein